MSHGPQNLSGSVDSFLFASDTPREFWSGSDAALWHSIDAGLNWNPVPFFEGVTVLSLARDPGRPNTLYAGTGFFTSRGLFQSNDRGVTWSSVPGTADFFDIYTISISPGDGSVLLGTELGIVYAPSLAGPFSIVVPGSSPTKIVRSPVDPSQAVAAVSAPNFALGGTVQYTTDGGKAWTLAAGFDGPDAMGIDAAYAPSDPSRVWVFSCTIDFNGKIWRSDDGGHSFGLVSTTPNIASGGGSNNVWVAPDDPSKLLVTGTGLWFSFDGGVNLPPVPFEIVAGIQRPHPDIHGIVSDPLYDGVANRRGYAWTDGGIFRSEDLLEVKTPHWTPLFNGHQSTLYTAIDVSPSGALLGAMWDTGLSSTAPGQLNTTHLIDMDGVGVAFDPTGGGGGYAAYFLGLLGRTSPPLFPAFLDVTGNAFSSISFTLDPTDPARMFAAGRIVVRVDGLPAAPVTTTIRPDSATGVGPIAVQPGNSNVVWIVENDGRAFRTEDSLSAGPVWEGRGLTAGSPPTSIIVDAFHPNTLYVGTVRLGVRKTVNAGASWTPVNGTGAQGLPKGPVFPDTVFPLSPVWALLQDPSHGKRIYAGTNVGLFATDDGGSTWFRAPGIAGIVPVKSLKIQPGTRRLYVGTHGRGIWSTCLGFERGRGCF